ncbi:MAG: hypothetical protein IPP35_05960 [Elusimicrobia bacterium]|nr:hypothetical protein [Elusimicrobiota bacterium]
MERKWRRWAGAWLGGVYFAANVALAHAAETNFWTERRLLAGRGGTLLAGLPSLQTPVLPGSSGTTQKVEPTLPEKIQRSLPASFLLTHGGLFRSLPTAFGSLRSVSLPPRVSPFSPIIIHIQDIHRNAEAQRHISSVVASLGPLSDLILLEGSTRPMDLARFRAFPERAAVQLAAEESLAQNEITGPIHAVLTATGPFPSLIGVDDPCHYAANVEAYRRSALRMEEQKAKGADRAARLEEEKKKIFNPALYAFDQAVTGYAKGRTSLSDYVKAVTKGARVLPVDVRCFIEALAMENSLDFQAVESERSRAAEVLGSRLDPHELARLLAQGAAYRAGTLRYGEFYQYLKDLCAENGVPLGKNLDAYVRYVLLADGVDAGSLFSDLQSLEKDAYRRWSHSPLESGLVARSRRVFLTEKLVDFSLTPGEWREYAETPTAGLESFESFYQEAHVRDGAMAANVLSALQNIKRKTPRTSPVVLLITGGYHAPGITEDLNRAGAVVLSFVPKVEKIDVAEGQVALGIFTQEKTPLQKLFEGEKLFLGQDPCPRAAEQLALPLKTAATSRDPQNAMEQLAPSLRRRVVRFAEGLSLPLARGTYSVRKDLSAPLGRRLLGRAESFGVWSEVWSRMARVARNAWVLARSKISRPPVSSRTNEQAPRAVSPAPAALPGEVTAILDRAFAMAQSAVLEAGNYLLAEQRKAIGTNKADGSWVSHADLESERRVIGSIREAFPTHAIVGEENMADLVAESDFVWYIDPLDGTSNYLGKNSGRENRWGVLIGLLFRGNPVLGISYFPSIPGPDGHPLLIKARADDPPGFWVGDQFHRPVDESRLSSRPGDWTVMGHGDYRNGRPFPALGRAEQVFGRTERHASSIALWLALMSLNKVGISLPGFAVNPAAYAKEEVKEWDVVAPSVLLAQAGCVISLDFGRTSFFPLAPSSTGDHARAGFAAALGSFHHATWQEVMNGFFDESTNGAAFNALARASGAFGWGAIAVGLAWFGLDGGVFGTLSGASALLGAGVVYGGSISFLNLKDALLTGIAREMAKRIFGEYSFPPEISDAAIQKVRSRFGGALGSTDRLRIETQERMNQRGRRGKFGWSLGTYGLTEYDQNHRPALSVMADWLFYKTPTADKSVLSGAGSRGPPTLWLRLFPWFQRHARNAVADREIRRRSPSPFLRNALALDLRRPFRFFSDKNQRRFFPSVRVTTQVQTFLPLPLAGEGGVFHRVTSRRPEPLPVRNKRDKGFSLPGWKPLAGLTGGLSLIPSAWAEAGDAIGWAGVWPLMRMFLTIAVPVYFAIVLHEVAHGWMALRRGDPTAQEEGRLSLNPLRHVDGVGTFLVPVVLSQFGILFGWAKPVPVSFARLRNPSGDIPWVAAAGPAANVAQLLFWMAALFVAAHEIYPAAPGLGTFLGAMAKIGIQVNVLMAVINLLPIPPLDGSKVILPFLPRWAAVLVFRMERLGIAVVLAVLFFAGGPIFQFMQGTAGFAITVALGGVLGVASMRRSANALRQRAQREAATTFRRLTASVQGARGTAVGEAWPYEGSLGLAQADGVLSWVRDMRGSLRSPEFRKVYGEALRAGKRRVPSFAGPADVLNRLSAVPSGEGGGRAGLVVPLMILSRESLGEMESIVSRLDEANQGRENPIHLVLAGTTIGVAERLVALKGARPYVHIIKSPVAPAGVLDPASLAQGVESLKDFSAAVPVSWRVGLSPGIHVDPNSIEVLGDVGSTGGLKRALLEFLQRLLKGDRATPSDWGAAIDIVALVLRNA